MRTGPAVAPAVPVRPGSIGMLGGTFDPVHVGHLAVAEEVREALGLERIVFVPAALPPHKVDRPVTAPEHRAAMVELAIADNPAFALSRIELERAGPSYTVDTLETLAAGMGDPASLVLIMSAEAFREFRTWRRPERILELARVAVVPRDGYPAASRAFLAEHFPGYEDRAVFLPGPRLRLSASDLRERAARGRSLRYLVPDAVASYIGDHALYSDPLWRKN
ncbi:MAG TPA: nicotinate-nucleotide adenylyltransferase [Clostridia bacterium]|nr:nicotinate-nucleotide adenylyltransferase [Clostridia bacterium]